MQVVLIVSNIDLTKHKKRGLIPQWESTYREGVASIAACLREAGHEVCLLKLSAGASEQEVKEIWERDLSGVDVAGFNVNTVDEPEVLRLSAIIKSVAPDVHIICGGVHATLSPARMIAHECVDSVCRGEGEEVMKDLCRRLSLGESISDIDGLWSKEHGRLYKNDPRPLIENLGTLPPPARDLVVFSNFDQSRYSDKTFFMGTRGCPYGCTYCCNASLRNIHKNHAQYFRYKPVDMIIGEIRRELDARPGSRWVAMYDDAMMVDKDWFGAFCDRWAREIRIPVFLTGRWELFDEITVPLLKKIHRRFLLVGVEVGDEDLRCDTLGRRQSDELMRKKSDLLKRHRIHYALYTMVGLPGEDLGKALKTVKLAARLAIMPLPGHHTIFYPFEGTSLYEQCESEGILSERHVGSYFSDTKLDMRDFPRKQVVKAHRGFTRFFLLYWFVLRLPSCFFGLSRLLEKWLDRKWMAIGRTA